MDCMDISFSWSALLWYHSDPSPSDLFATIRMLLLRVVLNVRIRFCQSCL